MDPFSFWVTHAFVSFPVKDAELAWRLQTDPAAGLLGGEATLGHPGTHLCARPAPRSFPGGGYGKHQGHPNLHGQPGSLIQKGPGGLSALCIWALHCPALVSCVSWFLRLGETPPGDSFIITKRTSVSFLKVNCNVDSRTTSMCLSYSVAFVSVTFKCIHLKKIFKLIY